MADFASSTHCHRWILSRQAVREKHAKANERARGALTQYGATRLEQQADGSLVYAGRGEGGGVAATGGAAPEPLAVDEELLVQRFYEEKIQQVCAAFSFPHKIQGTAIVYFKRFYLNWSVMEHDPKHIMLTCIYLACKVEEFHVSADELGKGIQQDPQVLLRNELTVLQSLDFELIVYTPYRALDGYVCEMERWGGVAAAAARELLEAARFEVDAMMLTDVPLLFSPGLVAMAALRSANREERRTDMERFVEELCRSLSAPYAELYEALDAVDVAAADVRRTVEADVKRIDRKLKICRHPGLQDETKKRERKVKHKQRRAGQDAPAGQDGPEVELIGAHGVKRRHLEPSSIL